MSAVLSMTATPTFLQPVPEQPTREATLNYQGGSMTTTRGVLAQMFKDAAFLSSCVAESVPRSRKSYTRTDYVGATVQVVPESNWTELKYPSQTKSTAKGGEPIQVRLNGEWWSARLSGGHSAFMTYLCTARDSLVGPIAWRSARGTVYGPIAPSTSD